MLKIAICDDIEITCSEIERILINYAKKRLINIDIDVFTSGEELCEIMKSKESYDLIFLDIELTNMNGIEVGTFIREVLKDDITNIIYISAKDNYLKELFSIRPMNFIEKPIKAQDIIDNVEKAIQLIGVQENTFLYKQGRNTFVIRIKNILYFEANRRELRMVTTDGPVYFYGNLSEVYKKLEKKRFFFAHKSYLVNFIHVIEFSQKMLIVSNKDIIPISRNKRDEVTEFLIRCNGEE